jgi:hypothetical protein
VSNPDTGGAAGALLHFLRKVAVDKMKASMSTTGFRDHFSSVASRYADFRPHYPAELFDYLATLVPRSSLVWDCACGNGQATLDLAKRFDRVVATDASREQIASATPHPQVEYCVAPAEQNGLPDTRPDSLCGRSRCGSAGSELLLTPFPGPHCENVRTSAR